MISLDSAAIEVFQILRSYDYTVMMYDDDGNQVYEPEQARRFFAKPKNLLVSLIEAGDNTSIRLYIGKSTDLQDILGLDQSLRVTATKYNMLFRLKRFGRELNPKQFATRNSVRENKEETMELLTEGMYGTTRSSYLKMENARMIVRHSKKIDEMVAGARGRFVESIFIENSMGERFLFPTRQLAPARAMTQHVNHGGTFADQVGQHITRMAQDYANLATGSGYIAANASNLNESAFKIRQACKSKMHEMRKCFERLYRSSNGYVNEARRIEESSALNENELNETAVDLTEIKNALMFEGEELGENVLRSMAEAYEQLDEISDRTVWNYGKKASEDKTKDRTKGLQMYSRHMDRSWKRQGEENERQRREKMANYTPVVHDLSDEADEPGMAYATTQTSDDIHDGDVLDLGNGRVGIMMSAWPVLVFGKNDRRLGFHGLASGESFETMDGGIYKKSYDLAKKVAGDSAPTNHDEDDGDHNDYELDEGRKAALNHDDVACPTCGGSGVAKGQSSVDFDSHLDVDKKCPTCHGRGVMMTSVMGRPISVKAWQKLISSPPQLDLYKMPHFSAHLRMADKDSNGNPIVYKPILVKKKDGTIGEAISAERVKELPVKLAEIVPQVMNDSMMNFLTFVEDKLANGKFSSPQERNHLYMIADAAVKGARVGTDGDDEVFQTRKDPEDKLAVTSEAVREFDEWMSRFDPNSVLQEANWDENEAASADLADGDTTIGEAEDYTSIESGRRDDAEERAVDEVVNDFDVNDFLDIYGADFSWNDDSEEEKKFEKSYILNSLEHYLGKKVEQQYDLEDVDMCSAAKTLWPEVRNALEGAGYEITEDALNRADMVIQTNQDASLKREVTKPVSTDPFTGEEGDVDSTYIARLMTLSGKPWNR